MKYFTLIVLLSLYGCGGTSTGNPVSEVTIRMEDLQPFAYWKKTLDSIIPSALANTSSNIKFCFKRLRFKPESNSSVDNIDLSIGQVNIDPNGTNILSVNIPDGTYRRIEFDLDKECDGVAGKPSVSFTNTISPFNYSTLDSITIKFEGTYTVDKSGTLNLNIDALTDALDTINNSGNIKTSLENATGDF